MTMSDLATLIQDTSAKIEETKTFLAIDANDYYALVQLETLQNRLTSLQERFDAVAADQRIQVLRYRLLVDGEQPSVRTVNDLLSSFQQSFTVVYDSITTGSAKKRARVSEASVNASTFGFAFSYSGSLGFALTLPTEMTLLNDDYETTIDAMEELLEATNERDIKDFAEAYGIGAIRTLYKWIDAVVKSGFDAELDWRLDATEPEPFLIQHADVYAVRNLISLTSDTTNVERDYRGTLVAYDSVRRTFRFSVGNAAMIHGTVSEGVTDQLTVPAPYNIHVRVATITRYSTEQKEEKFELLRFF